MRNNGIVNTGSGNVVANGAVIGDPTGTDGDSNNGVINTGSGTVVASGAVIGSGNQSNQGGKSRGSNRR